MCSRAGNQIPFVSSDCFHCMCYFTSLFIQEDCKTCTDRILTAIIVCSGGEPAQVRYLQCFGCHRAAVLWRAPFSLRLYFVSPSTSQSLTPLRVRLSSLIINFYCCQWFCLILIACCSIGSDNYTYLPYKRKHFISVVAFSFWASESVVWSKLAFQFVRQTQNPKQSFWNCSGCVRLFYSMHTWEFHQFGCTSSGYFMSVFALVTFIHYHQDNVTQCFFICHNIPSPSWNIFHCQGTFFFSPSCVFWPHY